MKKRLILSAILLVALSGCGTASVDQSVDSATTATTDSSSTVTEQPNTVTISNFAFLPDTLTVAAGDTVTWVHDDKVTHTIFFADFESENMERGDTFTHTFDAPGTYEYHCSIHPSMRGEIIVN